MLQYATVCIEGCLWNCVTIYEKIKTNKKIEKNQGFVNLTRKKIESVLP